MKLFILYSTYYPWVGDLSLRKDLPCPSCGSHHMVECGKPLGKQRYLGDCGKYFLGDATYHRHPRWKVEQALRMYLNGMSVRAISRAFNNKRFGGASNTASASVTTWTFQST